MPDKVKVDRDERNRLIYIPRVAIYARMSLKKGSLNHWKKKIFSVRLQQ